MKAYRKISLFTGILFIIGTAAGVLSMSATQPLLSAPNYLQAIAAHETRWITGALLVLVMGLPLAMVPVVLFPVLRKQNEILAIGAILFRGALEAVAYLLSAACLLLLLSVGRQAAANAGPALLDLGSLLRAASDWLELLLAILFSIGSILINLLLFQMRVIPRWLSGWGLIGSILYFAAPFISLLSPAHPAFGFDSPLAFLIAPLALEEMIFALWLIVKGFNPAASLKKQPAYSIA